MSTPRILHRQRMQSELLLHFIELGCLRIVQRHPNETVGATEILVNFTGGDFGEFPAILIHDAAD
jgi:hypothetical protein